MTIIESLRSKLNGNVPLVADRIRASQVEKNDIMPYVVFFVIAEPHEHHMTGNTGIARSLVQINCVADTPIISWDVSEEVRTVLDSGNGVWGTLQVRRSHLVNRSGPEFFDVKDGSQVGKYLTRMDFEIDYIESI